MTQCNGKSVTFSSLGRKKIQADFNGGQITSDAGLLLLREVDRRIGLMDAIDRCIPDPRKADQVDHQQRTLLTQRIFAIAAGYEDLNDHDQLRHDVLMQSVVDRPPSHQAEPLASSPTLCRLENRVDRAALAKIAEVFVEQFIASQHETPQELVLDFDATDDRVHGQQQGRFFHGYYDHYCFLPLYVFCGDQLLAAYLRPANIDGAKHSRAILKLLVSRFRKQWPDVRIVIRGDSGFCRWRLMRWCDKHGVDYVLGLARNKTLERLAAPLAEQSRRQFEHSDQKQRLFGEIQYAAKTWDRSRRVIVKAEHLSQGPNQRFVVTSLDDDPQQLYDTRYCMRGDMENRIKEQQLDLFADRTSCHHFLANQFRLLLASAAYVLLETLRREALHDTALARAQCGTIRLRLLKIGARVVRSVRRVVLHLASGYPLQELFRLIVSRLRSLPVLSNASP